VTLPTPSRTILSLATATGLLGALVRFLGLVRWPFAIPHLARALTDPATTPATRDTVDVTVQTLNRYLGVAVGEHRGYLFTGLWSALAGVAVIQSEVLPPYLASSGSSLRPRSCSVLWSSSVRSKRTGGSAPALCPLAYIGWSLWLLALGIGLLFAG
jgi:Domain of unknown function (DUF4386)